ncbi:uncharacterized protein I206_102555 [Kwoniella pini CBS 10737]|uniref:RlpA-like protein double-psi beta-barrel domain-containing protein n=1 Tax=Kwoniella pini CBS 10737 TaxID=1296096 RepID=A0A1B9I5P0_9TREE|nr:uncharacterized protein I206_02905 [Kwoniella pini CBS 10737]OCF50848.1 hypothetical protein I206_02905 [Kwoniella pini CBS 10737]
MHSFTTVATFALVASASIVSAAPIACRGKPDNYVDGYLEDYDVYHARYIALDCSTQHNTTFFDDCCHPLLANETLSDNRLAYCTPNTTTLAEVSSTLAEYSATATVSATATASADVDAASEYSAAEATATSASASIAAVADYAGHHSKSKSASSTSTEAAWTATSTSSAAAETSSAASSGGQVMTGGYATYFYQGGNAGACGTVHSDYDKIIAIDTNGWWQDTSSASPYCGKYITLTNTNNGKSVTAMVADACPSCVSDNSLDLSVGAFEAIADSLSDGQVPITWVWA